ncbi:MAG TPA: hypothetical protein VLV50_08110 [Stellaceae bacterium]|nr:hypothetical protein [Stellaceae bacterium]
MIFSSRGLVPAALAAVMAFCATAGAAPAAAGATAITCTNSASGYTWQIEVDYAKRTVNTYPARINADEISWRDEKDGYNYTLDRASGKLTQVFASSTGGNMLFHSCAVKN